MNRIGLVMVRRNKHEAGVSGCYMGDRDVSYKTGQRLKDQRRRAQPNRRNSFRANAESAAADDLSSPWCHVSLQAD